LVGRATTHVTRDVDVARSTAVGQQQESSSAVRSYDNRLIVTPPAAVSSRGCVQQKRAGGQKVLLENNVHMFSHLEQKRGVLQSPSKVGHKTRRIPCCGKMGAVLDVCSHRNFQPFSYLVVPSATRTCSTLKPKLFHEHGRLLRNLRKTAMVNRIFLEKCPPNDGEYSAHHLRVTIVTIITPLTSPGRIRLLSGGHSSCDLDSGTQVQKRGGYWCNSKSSGDADGVQESRHGLQHSPGQGVVARKQPVVDAIVDL